jgi:hypothetical protein
MKFSSNKLFPYYCRQLPAAAEVVVSDKFVEAKLQLIGKLRGGRRKPHGK